MITKRAKHIVWVSVGFVVVLLLVFLQDMLLQVLADRDWLVKVPRWLAVLAAALTLTKGFVKSLGAVRQTIAAQQVEGHVAVLVIDIARGPGLPGGPVTEQTK